MNAINLRMYSGGNLSTGCKSDAYKTVDGKLVVDIRQRVPLLRIIDKNNESYYIDQVDIHNEIIRKFYYSCDCDQWQYMEQNSLLMDLSMCWIWKKNTLEIGIIEAEYL